MRRILTVVLVVAMSAAVGATVLVPVDLGGLSRDARAIARGTVVAVDGRWTDDRQTIETLVTLEIEAYLKGQLGDTVQFRVPGGSLGRYRRIVVGAPQFLVGQQVIVFLGAHGPSVPYVLGMSQGVFRVGRTAAGGLIVSPPAIPASVAGPIVRGSVSRQPEPLADFEREVRTLSGIAP